MSAMPRIASKASQRKLELCMNDKKTILVSGAVLFRDNNGKIQWLLVKETPEDDWEIAKTIVRKGESSVRAVMRMLGQKASMSGRVLEEVGRSGGVSTVNGKTVPRRFIYYVMLTRSQASEAIGFADTVWLEAKDAGKKLSSKKEITMIKDAYEYYKNWKKQGGMLKVDQEEEELLKEAQEAEAAEAEAALKNGA
jgi:hypothetical protein